MLARVLLALIGLGLAVALVGWLVRSQPFGPAGPIGSPLPASHQALAGWRPRTRATRPPAARRPGGSAPFARLEMATAGHDGRIWLAGGFEPDGSATDAVSVFDPAAGSWSEAFPLPQPLHHAALASTGDELVLVGGYLGSTGEPWDPESWWWYFRAAGSPAARAARSRGGGV